MYNVNSYFSILHAMLQEYQTELLVFLVLPQHYLHMSILYKSSRLWNATPISPALVERNLDRIRTLSEVIKIKI